MYKGVLANGLPFQHTEAFSIDSWLKHEIDDMKVECEMAKIL